MFGRDIKEGCNHIWGKIDDGYQYCITCGIAIVAPKAGCSHVYDKPTRYMVTNLFGDIEYMEITMSLIGSASDILMVSRCTVCGDIKKERLSK